MKYNVPALVSEEHYEVTVFETPETEGEMEVRYYPRDHRAEVEPEELSDLETDDEREQALLDRNLEFEARGYGDSTDYIDVQLAKDSGMHLVDNTGDKVSQLLDPK